VFPDTTQMESLFYYPASRRIETGRNDGFTPLTGTLFGALRQLERLIDEKLVAFVSGGYTFEKKEN
jgi:hypothetical protein